MTSYDLSLALIAGDWHHTRLTITNILEAAFAAIEKKEVHNKCPSRLIYCL